MDAQPVVKRRTVVTAAAWIGASVFAAFVALVAGLTMAWRLVLLVVGVALGGCAALPPPIERPVSHARTDVIETPLAKLAAASLGNGADADPRSAFLLLTDGGEALEARLALVRRAEKSLDVQSYLIADDGAGRELLAELGAAAARGVRVRLLLDDLHAGGRDGELAGLAAGRDVQVRLFNPMPVRDGGVVRRIVGSLHEFPRVNRRMHNKLLVADGSFAIAGGRNVADAYFDRARDASFIDIDVLAAGPVVTALSAVFDRYWNAEASQPVGRFATAPPPHATALREAPIVAERDGDSFDARLAGGRLAFDLAVADVLADAPDKALGDDGAPTVAQAHLALLRSAESSIVLASPYVIPCRGTIEALAALRSRDGSVGLLTNSLETTDEPLVHLAYARHRPSLLEAGVTLHELRPSASAGRSIDRLHAKLAVIDGRRAFVGSMNLDPRSARLNTEMALVVHSPATAARLAEFVQRHQQQASDRIVRHAFGLRRPAGSQPGSDRRSADPEAKAMPWLPIRWLARLLGDGLL